VLFLYNVFITICTGSDVVFERFVNFPQVIKPMGYKQSDNEAEYGSNNVTGYADNECAAPYLVPVPHNGLGLSCSRIHDSIAVMRPSMLTDSSFNASVFLIVAFLLSRRSTAALNTPRVSRHIDQKIAHAAAMTMIRVSVLFTYRVGRYASVGRPLLR
jgi:hypothetical protein